MSRIDDLLAELCPNGVPFRTLGEVGEFIRGSGLQKSDLTDAGSPAIHCGQIHTYYGTWATETKSFVSDALAAGLRRARPGDLVIATTSEDDAAVAKATAWLGDGDVAVSGDAHIYRHTLAPKYVAYFFESKHFQDQKKRHITGTKVRRLSGDSLAMIRIPVPPVEVQRQLVDVLDTFAELEAELEGRRRQYEHYRDSVLAFSGTEGVRWLPMGEVGAFIRGKRFTKADYVVDGIPCIHYGEIYTEFGPHTDVVVSHVKPQLRSSLRFARPGDVVIVDVGETVNDVGKAVAWLGDADVAIHDHCFAFRHDLDPAFVSYYMQTSRFRVDKAKHIARTKVKTLLMGGLAKVLIPVPPPAEQVRVVGILDTFDALINDLSIGLPAELKSRCQQYEYYRDKLLTFEERVA